jgi:hypothetical protein
VTSSGFDFSLDTSGDLGFVSIFYSTVCSKTSFFLRSSCFDAFKASALLGGEGRGRASKAVLREINPTKFPYLSKMLNLSFRPWPLLYSKEK